MAKTNHTLCSVEGCVRKSKARGYCSQHYSIARKLELKNGAAPCIITPRKIAKCRRCGISFKPKTSTRTEFCSRQCYFDAKAIAPSSSVYAGFCKGCGKAFISKRPRQYCCLECRPVVDYVSKAPDEKVCACCGAKYAPSFTGGRPSEFCSIACRSIIGNASRRIDKARRAAVKRGATVERVDPFVVFDRDGWKCQLCGRKTPAKLRGTYEDDAPELDHILPLAAGGEHSYRNTQCSCRRCNGLKSDTPRGQALLFG